MHKHPLPQKHRQKNGEYTPPLHHHGMLADVTFPKYVPLKWTPPVEYEHIARYYMTDSTEYIKKCKQWIQDNPTPSREPPPVKNKINAEAIAILYSKYCPCVPPIDELVAVCQNAGVSQDKIDRLETVRRRGPTPETQAYIDTMFSKWPSANKPTPKVKPVTKMIKAVKKNQINPAVDNKI